MRFFWIRIFLRSKIQFKEYLQLEYGQKSPKLYVIIYKRELIKIIDEYKKLVMNFLIKI